MVGDRDGDDALVSIGIVDQDVDVLIACANRIFTTGSGKDGVFYRMDITNGNISVSAVNFGSTMYHIPISMFFYPLVLSHFK